MSDSRAGQGCRRCGGASLKEEKPVANDGAYPLNTGEIIHAGPRNPVETTNKPRHFSGSGS